MFPTPSPVIPIRLIGILGDLYMRFRRFKKFHLGSLSETCESNVENKGNKDGVANSKCDMHVQRRKQGEQRQMKIKMRNATPNSFYHVRPDRTAPAQGQLKVEVAVNSGSQVQNETYKSNVENNGRKDGVAN